MKKVGMLIIAMATVALLASCASNNKQSAPVSGKKPAMHHDTKGEMMDAKGELRMK